MITERKVLFIKCDGDGRRYVGGTTTPGVCDVEAPSWEVTADGCEAESRQELEEDSKAHGWVTREDKHYCYFCKEDILRERTKNEQ